MEHVLIVNGVWQFGHQIFNKLIWCSFMGMGLVIGVVIARNIKKKLVWKLKHAYNISTQVHDVWSIITSKIACSLLSHLHLQIRCFINYTKGDYLKDISSKFLWLMLLVKMLLIYRHSFSFGQVWVEFFSSIFLKKTI